MTEARVIPIKEDLNLKKGSLLIVTSDDQLFVGTSVLEATPSPVTVLVQPTATAPPEPELAWSPGQEQVQIKRRPSTAPHRRSLAVKVPGEPEPVTVRGICSDILKQLHATNNKPMSARDILNGVGGLSPSARLTEMHHDGLLTRFGNARGPYEYVASSRGQEIAAALCANGKAS